jgi:flagellar basal-body rod protein FlgC
MKIMLSALVLIFSSQNILASTSCERELQNKKMEMSVIASNIVNAKTTRTPEGGAYQIQSLVCKNLNCEINKSSDFIFKYEPTHPDAQENGMVTYPRIDIKDQTQKMLLVQKDYEKILETCRTNN